MLRDCAIIDSLNCLLQVHWPTIVFSLVFMVIVVGLKKLSVLQPWSECSRVLCYSLHSKRTRHVYSLITVVLSSVAALVLDKFVSGNGRLS